jgi:hypothetical protein
LLTQGDSADSSDPGIRVRDAGVAPDFQVGDPVSGAAGWRSELHLGESNVHVAEAWAGLGADAAPSGALNDFDRLGLRLRRWTAVLGGTGAASADAQVQDRLARSGQAWERTAGASQQRGQAAARRLLGVDEAWGRAPPDWDWVSPWTGWIPPRHVRTWEQP